MWSNSTNGVPTQPGMTQLYVTSLGLSETLKDELARLDPPTSLSDLIQLAIQLDRRI